MVFFYAFMIPVEVDHCTVSVGNSLFHSLLNQRPAVEIIESNSETRENS